MTIFERTLDLKDDVIVYGHRYLLSTVDLCVEHIGGRFETMLFERCYGGKVNWRDLYCDRYDTKDEAIAGHNKLLERLQNGERIWE